MNNLKLNPIGDFPEFRDLLSWFNLSKDDVLDRFAASAMHRIDRGAGDQRFVYIPGSRPDRVLLVAHADTYFDGRPGYPADVIVQEGKLRSANPALACGADDRAGCAVLWQLRELGHSLLITSGEEKGRQASTWLMEKNPDLADEINRTHGFVVQLDRRNGTDYKCYEVGTPQFRHYVERKTGYTEPDRSSYTDICTLCRDIPGVNLSVGYYNEHTEEEYLDLDQWRSTLTLVRSWLSRRGLPNFRLRANFAARHAKSSDDIVPRSQRTFPGPGRLIQDWPLIEQFRELFPNPNHPPGERAALFYPSAGTDLQTPLLLGLPYCRQFFFYEHWRSKIQPEKLNWLRQAPFQNYEWVGWLEDKNMSQVSAPVDPGRPGGGPFGEFIVRFTYRDVPRELHWVCRDNKDFLKQDVDLSFYFHRGDSYGEGGSRQYWDSDLLPQLVAKIPEDSYCPFLSTGEPGGEYPVLPKLLEHQVGDTMVFNLGDYYIGRLTKDILVPERIPAFMRMSLRCNTMSEGTR
ncbi:MAG TPA: hypothetical protein PLN27_15620 [Acidobacteriota bacterium]|nr:hypothetical protein [Acidobacteriota bacterium]